jgi:hypothetical protein
MRHTYSLKKCVLKGVESTLLKGWSDQKQLAIDIGNLRKKQLVARIGMALTHIWKVNKKKARIWMAIAHIWRVNLQDWMISPEMMSNNKDTLGTSKNTQSAQQWHFRFLMPEKKSFYGCIRFLLTLVVVLFAHVCPRNTTWLVRIPFCPTCQVRVSRF